ncbi:hypothetical protein HA402_005271 [Bradysia odoriphaga]|nr:hypothetical protein HA402_005271 [Bradysia odoriphaga]
MTPINVAIRGLRIHAGTVTVITLPAGAGCGGISGRCGSAPGRYAVGSDLSGVAAAPGSCRCERWQAP